MCAVGFTDLKPAVFLSTISPTPLFFNILAHYKCLKNNQDIMAGINKVILVGNLGRDPEVTTYENGVKRAAFSLATTESYRDKEGNWQEQTEWHNIVLWRWLAEKIWLKEIKYIWKADSEPDHGMMKMAKKDILLKYRVIKY